MKKPQLSVEQAVEWSESLGQSTAGTYRQIVLAQEMGVPQALGLTTEEWVQDRLGGYVRLSIPERREAVAELSEEGMSGRDAAAVLGVDEKTVRRDAAANAAAEPDDPNEDGPDDDETAANAAPDPEPPTPIKAAPDPGPGEDELAQDDVRLRRSKARKMLVNAQAALNALSPCVEEVAEAVLAQGPDEIKSAKADIDRDMAVLKRLKAAVSQPANLRRVK